MRRRITAALVALIACAPVHAQSTWNLARCGTTAPVGHLCTPEHLETDLVLLTARFLDPERQAAELRHRRDPQTHIRNPEASLPDPRTDPTLIQLLHAWAESGLLESEAPQRGTAAPPALKGIKAMSVNLEDADPKDARCSPANDAVRLAALGPISSGGIKVVSHELASPALYVGMTTLPIGPDACGAFLSVTLRDFPYVAPGYQQPPKTASRIVLESGLFVSSPAPEFTSRVTEQLRRTVDGYISQIKLARQIH
jgi:hypothetical protein